MHKITLFEDVERKIVRPKFWSLGTALEYLGPVFQKALGLGFYQMQFLVIWGPYDLPILVAPQAHAKNPKSAGARCGITNAATSLQCGFFELFKATFHP